MSRGGDQESNNKNLEGGKSKISTCGVERKQRVGRNMYTQGGERVGGGIYVHARRGERTGEIKNGKYKYTRDQEGSRDEQEAKSTHWPR